MTNELQTKAGIKADVFPVVHQELKQASPGSLNKTVFIVDEASMLSSAQGHELIKHVELTGARLVLVSDKAQLPSVNSGRLFWLTQDYEQALATLKRRQGEHAEFVFTYQGKPIQQCNTKAWRKALERAGIENFRWHDLRHTWASWHIQNGTTLQELQQLGGWSSVEMVLR